MDDTLRTEGFDEEDGMQYREFKGYVVTANDDGSIPLSSRVIAEPTADGKVKVDTKWLVDRLNRAEKEEGA